MKNLILLFILLLNSVLYAQINGNHHFHFEGLIANKYPVKMQLNLTDGEAEGSYYYTNHKKNIKLNGVYTSNGNINLIEYANGNKTGSFKGKLIGKTYSGEWQKADGSQSLSFSLSLKYTFKRKDSSGYIVYNYQNFVNLFKKNDSIGIDVDFHSVFPSTNIKILNLISDSTLTYANIPLDEKVQSVIDAVIFGYFDDMSTFSKSEILDDPWMANYSDNTYISPFFENNNFLVIDYSIYSYTGGAHGNGWSVSYVLDKNDLHFLHIDEVIYEKYFDIIHQLSLKKLEKDGRIEDLFSKDFDVSDNFYFNNDSLYLYYNNYEIAPYVAGPIEIGFDYNEIKQYMTPYFKKAMKIK